MSTYEIILNGYLSDSIENDQFFESPPRYLMILWPSTGGNARSFRIKESELVSNKILLLRYNPTSHGNSEGNYDPQASINHLLDYIKVKNLNEIPVFGIGHSGGGAALVMMEGKLNFKKRFLLSPILNSRISLEYLYEQNKIEEFLILLESDKKSEDEDIERKNSLIWKHLSDSKWLYSGDVSELHFSVSNQKIRLKDLAVFLKNLFLPGFDITEQLLNLNSRVQIFLPTEDHWFPLERTKGFSRRQNITITDIASANDHFFSKSWISVWEKIRSEIFT